jgi:hypothetical protein
MPIHPAHSILPMRTLWLACVAILAALAVWLFVPGGRAPSLTGGGDAALPPSLMVDGAVSATSENGSVVRLEVPLAVRGDDRIRLTQDGRIHAVTYMAETASAAVPATYTLSWLNGNGDEFLDLGEHAVLTAQLPAGSLVTAENPAKLVIKPVDSTPLTIEDVLP